MSTIMQQLLNKAQDDPELQQRLESVLDEEDKGQALSRIATIASAAGFDVSVADVEAALSAEAGADELSDEALEQVAGGSWATLNFSPRARKRWRLASETRFNTAIFNTADVSGTAT